MTNTTVTTNRKVIIFICSFEICRALFVVCFQNWGIELGRSGPSVLVARYPCLVFGGMATWHSSRLVVQDNAQERTVDVEPTVRVNEALFLEFIKEHIDP